MIEFFSETNFEFENEETISQWISSIIKMEKHEEGDINFIFCDDDYLLKLNQDFLQHDTLTDIISFDNSLGKEIHGEIYISIDRIKDNAKKFSVTFNEEIHRVLIHGILHFCGYKDKTKKDAVQMRKGEDLALKHLSIN